MIFRHPTVLSTNTKPDTLPRVFPAKSIEFFDTYSPIARISSIRILLAFALIQNMFIHQMDVKTAFLNGNLDEEIYVDRSMDS